MSSRANIDIHLANMIGGRGIPQRGTWGYAPGAIAIKSTGVVGNGIYINQGDKDSCDFVSQDGLSAILAGGAEQDIHEIDTTQNYDLGSRLTQHGSGGSRTFHYAKAVSVIEDLKFGLKFYGKLDTTSGVTYAAPTQTQLATAKVITVDAGASGDHTADEFRGGYLTVHTHTDNNQVTRKVVSNTASSAAGYITFTVDKPWTKAIETGYGVEVIGNIYKDIRLCSSGVGVGAGDKYSSVAGMPMVRTTVANTYIWIQTWGPIFVIPHGASLQDAGIATDERRLVFDYEGSVSIQEDCVGATDDHQSAGFIIDRNAAGVMALPLCMLQISP